MLRCNAPRPLRWRPYVPRAWQPYVPCISWVRPGCALPEPSAHARQRAPQAGRAGQGRAGGRQTMASASRAGGIKLDAIGTTASQSLALAARACRASNPRVGHPRSTGVRKVNARQASPSRAYLRDRDARRWPLCRVMELADTNRAAPRESKPRCQRGAGGGTERVTNRCAGLGNQGRGRNTDAFEALITLAPSLKLPLLKASASRRVITESPAVCPAAAAMADDEQLEQQEDTTKDRQGREQAAALDKVTDNVGRRRRRTHARAAASLRCPAGCNSRNACMCGACGCMFICWLLPLPPRRSPKSS